LIKDIELEKKFNQNLKRKCQVNGKFLIASELEPVHLDWGVQHWFSDPKTTGAQDLVVVSVEMGEIEQWLGEEKQILKKGDSAFIPTGLVHASFNISDKPVKALAILGPCIGDEGYELVDVSNQAPWNELRS
jgi:hypothetical protein